MLDTLSPGVLWFLVGLVCIAAELVVPGFVIIFFGIGAWCTALCCWVGLTGSFDSQLLVFLGATVLSLALLRKQGKRWLGGRVTGVLEPGKNFEDFQGGRAIVVEDIAPRGAGGKVEYHGTVWQADADVPISRGTVVTVASRDGLCLKVHPLT